MRCVLSNTNLYAARNIFTSTKLLHDKTTMKTVAACGQIILNVNSCKAIILMVVLLEEQTSIK